MEKKMTITDSSDPPDMDRFRHVLREIVLDFIMGQGGAIAVAAELRDLAGEVDDGLRWNNWDDAGKPAP